MRCPWGGKGETGPMLGEERVVSQRTRMGVMAKQPETSYCWGPSPNEGGAEGPHGGPQSCIFNIVCIYGAQLPRGRVLCLEVPLGTLGPPQVGRGLGGRVSLLCPNGGPETSPCIAGSWVGAQDPSAPLPLPGHGPCPAGHAGPRWNGWGSGGPDISRS